MSAKAPRTGRGSHRPSAPQEVELKFSVSDVPAVKEWLTGQLGSGFEDLRVTEPVTTEVEDRYFDTQHGALERRGFGARLRRRDGATTLTVKARGRPRLPGGEPVPPRMRALHRRTELEAPATPRLDPDSWPQSPARELVDELRGAARLRALFTIRQRRHERHIEGREGRALLSVDEVEVLSGRRPVGTFAALELEASDGGGALLDRLAPWLLSSELLRPESRSKETLARQMVDQHAARSAGETATTRLRVPRTPGMRAEDTLAEAGRKVLRMHLARMLASEPGTRSGEDPEELHKMRVATRRMRAAWRVFDGAYRPRLQRRYVRELRGVASALGTVRDLDVQIEAVGGYLAVLPEEGTQALEPLVAEWRRQREAGRRDLLELLDSRDYRDFVDDYLDFVETSGSGELVANPGEPMLVRDNVGGRIWLAYERVRARGTQLEWADVPALHALRIEGKRLRYTLEFFQEVLPPRIERLIDRVTEMQDHLGMLNDADISAHLAREWLTTRGPRLTEPTRQAVVQYLASREAEVRRLRRSFGPIWRRVDSPVFRRSLALAISAP